MYQVLITISLKFHLHKIGAMDCKWTPESFNSIESVAMFELFTNMFNADDASR